ncbi:MAG: nucleoside diphosphate kinase regulator [Rhizomicrobium sp.]
MSIARHLPRIAIGAADLERLANLAESARHTHPDIAEYLVRELDRANIVEGETGPARIRMGSQVEYRDEDTGQVRSIQLVYPSESDPEHGRISVLTPIGAALIGLAEGQSIEWTARSGAPRMLTVLKVGAFAAAH